MVLILSISSLNVRKFLLWRFFLIIIILIYHFALFVRFVLIYLELFLFVVGKWNFKIECRNFLGSYKAIFGKIVSHYFLFERYNMMQILFNFLIFEQKLITAPKLFIHLILNILLFQFDFFPLGFLAHKSLFYFFLSFFTIVIL